ncbi:MAG: hypothetical protein ABIQ32_09920 [Sphingomicrobium sp.]
MSLPVSRRHLLAASPATLLAADAIAQTLGDPGPQGVVRLQPGVHQVNRDTNIRSDVIVEPGARIAIAAGARLTLLGDFSAPIGHVFTGSGTVDLSRSRIIEAYPEWWGANPENEADSAAALEFCLAAHPVMQLGPHSYYISRTLVVDRSNRHIRGSGQRWIGAGTGTRLVLTGDGDVMRIGTLKRPGSINDFVQGVMVSDLQLTRARPPSGSGHDGAAGMRMRHVLFADISRVDSSENVNGFALGGAVRSYLRDCSAFRSVHGGSTVFRGYACDGHVEIGAAGGNASIILIDCNARTGGNPPLSECVGMLMDGAFADTTVTNFETGSVAVGMRLSGDASRLSESKRRSGHADVRILAPVLDQCTNVGIEISDTSDYTMLDISDAYVASAPGSRAAMSFDRVRGLTTVRGGQLIGWTAPGAVGIVATASEGLDISGVKLLQFTEPARFTRCRDLALDLAINQPEGKGRGPAVLLVDCGETKVAARIKGTAGAFAGGVRVTGSATRAVSVDAGSVRPESVGGGQNRVALTGVPSGAVTLSGP